MLIDVHDLWRLPVIFKTGREEAAVGLGG
jgi:hypothetical protein